MVRAFKLPVPEPDLGQLAAKPVGPSAVPAGAAAMRNPVLQLQQDLEALWAAAPEPRWSARRTLGFLLATNGLFWLLLVLGLRSFV